MIIHEIKPGEKLSEVAANYGITEAELRSANGIKTGEAAVGEELLILVPTRTYTIQQGDSLERLCLRFGARKSELCAMNPDVSFESPHPGDVVSIRHAPKTHGIAAANGYFYRGCTADKLHRAMPYITYLTVASAVLENGRLTELFDGTEIAKKAKEHSKTPIIRIYNRAQPIASHRAPGELIDSLIEKAKAEGYKGIALGGELADGEEELSELLLEIKKQMIGSDLILITECEPDSPPCLSEFSDGSVLSFYKENLAAFDDAEKRAYSNFATRSEGAKTFIDLPCLATAEGGYIAYDEALNLARGGYAITTDKSSLISYFDHKRRGRITFPSLKNIKATLELISELGFMGISFDIMRTPHSFLAAYNSMYKTVTECSVRQIDV